MDRSRVSTNRWAVLGRAGLDLYADPPGTRVEDARSFYPAVGGSAANIAAGIARLGGWATMLTTLSQDAVGRFVLADHIVVDGADLQHGLLQLGLKRVVPEALKPRRIQIGTGTPAIANDQHKAEAKAA